MPEWLDRQVTSHLQHLLFWVERKGYKLNQEQRAMLVRLLILTRREQ